MILRSGKRLISYDKEQRKQKKKKIIKRCIKLDDDTSPRPYLHEEFIIENILIRLSARDLAVCSCVSKFWYNSILRDSKFCASHFIQNKNRLNLVFDLLNVVLKNWGWAYFFSLEEEERRQKRRKMSKNDKLLLKNRLLTGVSITGTNELVGHCNGLVCTKTITSATHNKGRITVINPTRGETLDLTFLTPTINGELCILLCNGFGFDSLSGEYKVVFIYTSTTRSGDQEFVCLVLTLGGTYAWRKIIISTSQISPPPGTSSSFPSSMITTARVAAGTLYGGDLVWWITNTAPSNNDTIDMLLSFDIHNEKIHFIRLPAECSPTPATTTVGKHQCLVVDHHLLEFKGYLCVARTEKIMIRNTNYHPHQHHYHHRSRRHHCYGPLRRFCCGGFKVDLFILKDRVNQVWIKGETFDVQIKEEDLLPAPYCCYFDTTTTATFPSTRILSFSGQLLLYWFDGEYLLLYNLQSKHLKVVEWSSSCNKQTRDIFHTKRKNRIRLGRCIGYDDNSFFPFMDYQLHAQAENIVSLKTFIPEGETIRFNTYNDFEQFMRNGGKEFAGLVSTQRESAQIHLFY